ncbi:MAG: hypothetical protein LVR00_04215 [Rhabdochlamydiaceae bacterium]|jgi:hypothetical protein
MDDYTKVMDQYFKICLTTDSEIEDTPQTPLSTEVSAIAQKNLLPPATPVEKKITPKTDTKATLIEKQKEEIAGLQSLVEFLREAP